MTLLSFHRLSPVDKQTYTLNNGVHIMDRQECKFLISLFAVHGYYVELYFHKKYIQAIKINAFESANHLEPYLETIDLSELLTPL